MYLCGDYKTLFSSRYAAQQTYKRPAIKICEDIKQKAHLYDGLFNYQLNAGCLRFCLHHFIIFLAVFFIQLNFSQPDVFRCHFYALILLDIFHTFLKCH